LKKGLKAAMIFAILFVAYDCAEYIILFKNTTLGLLVFQSAFFLMT
jgi:heme/copper-type cytochrome/quinol oxidase subunit 3